MSVNSLKKALIRKKNDLRHFFNKLRYDYQATTEKPVISRMKHVVIHRLDGKIGDAVCYAPFIRELKKAAPESRITVPAFLTKDQPLSHTLRITLLNVGR